MVRSTFETAYEYILQNNMEINVDLGLEPRSYALLTTSFATEPLRMRLIYNKQTNNIKESGLMAWKRARIFELAYHHLTRLRLLHIPEIQKHEATVSYAFF